jgi:hypothetical protein
MMGDRRHRAIRIVLAGLALVFRAAAAIAQEHTHQPAATSNAWQWSAEGSVFAGYNYQRRKFTDFDEVESQNWLMTSLWKTFSNGANIEFGGMFSLEPFTLRDIGSPQVFQTGETFEGAPLIDYQHPHDLIMNLGARVSRTVSATTVTIGAYAVGPAPLGPPAFMHRPSAILNPQAPLSHHYLDATHITPGVVSIGVERSGFGIEAGAFHGQEPDENRLDLDTAALDSYSVRASWADGPWRLQISGADLKTPERKSPYDATRVTASATYFKGDENRSLAWTAAFGQNREVFGNLEAYLFEAAKQSGRNAFYTRAENVEKDILDAGFHPIGAAHTHRPSRVSALTLGYMRDVVSRSFGTFAVGGDLTGYQVPDNLSESYGSPLSFHVFLRYRGRAGARLDHIH